MWGKNDEAIHGQSVCRGIDRVHCGGIEHDKHPRRRFEEQQACTQYWINPPAQPAGLAGPRSHDSSVVRGQRIASHDSATTTPIAVRCVNRNPQPFTHRQPSRLPATITINPHHEKHHRECRRRTASASKPGAGMTGAGRSSSCWTADTG